MPEFVWLSSCNEYIKCVTTLVLQLSHMPNTHLIPPIIVMFIILPNYIKASVAYNSSMVVVFEQSTLYCHSPTTLTVSVVMHFLCCMPLRNRKITAVIAIIAIAMIIMIPPPMIPEVEKLSSKCVILIVQVHRVIFW